MIPDPGHCLRPDYAAPASSLPPEPSTWQATLSEVARHVGDVSSCSEYRVQYFEKATSKLSHFMNLSKGF